MDAMREQAQKEANRAGIAIALGWQVNDNTGEREPGYCPASIAPHPCFVVEVVETIQPAG